MSDLLRSERRPARPDEVCTCGHPAVLVFVFEDPHREVPWCGVLDRKDWDKD